MRDNTTKSTIVEIIQQNWVNCKQIGRHLDHLRISFYNDWFMSDAKQILVVDDHFEVQDFLRSMFAVADEEYQVVAVPSAEEAYLELHRQPFDLLITDLRLPGKSGFELVEQARQRWPAMPVVVITAYSSADGRQEAADLGVFAYFEKPPDTGALLASALRAFEHGAGGGPGQEQPGPAGSTPPVTRPVPGPATTLPTAIDRCLHNLRADTGAAQVVLVSLTGDVLFVNGTQNDLDVSRLARMVAGGLDHNFALAAELESAEPFAIQYQAGNRHDLYSANVGRGHFLMLVVDAQARRGRMGTVWVFTQRAIKQLSGLLRELPTDSAADSVAGPPTTAPEKARRDRLPETSPQATAPPDEPSPPDGDEAHDPLLDLLTDDELEKLVDLDAFWAEALANGTTGEGSDGLSFEEALQRGLIPPQFGKATGES